MSVKPVLQFGHATLRRLAAPVKEFNTPELHQLVNSLFATKEATGGVGIAAPQIGVALQVVVFGFEHSERYPHAAAVPKTVLINPILIPLSQHQNEDWEGCLSTQGIRGLVNRYTSIRYSGYDELGNFFTRDAYGFHARLVQHELDHLNGTLYIERMNNLKYLGFEDELKELRRMSGSQLS